MRDTQITRLDRRIDDAERQQDIRRRALNEEMRRAERGLQEWLGAHDRRLDQIENTMLEQFETQPDAEPETDRGKMRSKLRDALLDVEQAPGLPFSAKIRILRNISNVYQSLGGK